MPVAVAAAGRTKPAVANAIEQMEAAGILPRLSESARNRAWEAAGLLDLIVGREAGVSSAGGVWPRGERVAEQPALPITA